MIRCVLDIRGSVLDTRGPGVLHTELIGGLVDVAAGQEVSVELLEASRVSGELVRGE